MTAPPPSPGYGDINDLLRQANGGSSEVFEWAGKGRQPIIERQAPTKEPNPVQDSGSKDVAAEQSGSRPASPKLQDDQEATETQPTGRKRKQKSSSPPSPSAASLSSAPLPKRHSVPRSHDAFLEAIKVFEQNKAKGQRHQVYLPDKVVNNLKACYGDRSLSAVLSILAMNHVESYKEEMRQTFIHRTDIF
jgi:hypothetical protein